MVDEAPYGTLNRAFIKALFPESSEVVLVTDGTKLIQCQGKLHQKQPDGVTVAVFDCGLWLKPIQEPLLEQVSTALVQYYLCERCGWRSGEQVVKDANRD